MHTIATLPKLGKDSSFKQWLNQFVKIWDISGLLYLRTTIEIHSGSVAFSGSNFVYKSSDFSACNKNITEILLSDTGELGKEMSFFFSNVVLESKIATKSFALSGEVDRTFQILGTYIASFKIRSAIFRKRRDPLCICFSNVGVDRAIPNALSVEMHRCL